MNDGIDTSPEEEAYAEAVAVATPIQTLTAKITLTKEQLADLERQRREIEAKELYDTWFNNEEQVEADTLAYYQAEIVKTIEVLKKAGIDNSVVQYQTAFCNGGWDYADISPATLKLVWDFHHKKTAKSAPKAKGEAKAKTEPTYEGKGKKAGTGDARAKDIATLNSGKISSLTYAKKVGNKTWSLMRNTLVIVKDNKGVYDMPIFKEVGGMIGVPMKTKQDYIDWIKTA
jgi:hypothetical protein